MFATASFLDARTGWVTTYGWGSARVRIFRTTDGGATWSSLPGGSHSPGAGSTTRVQLLTPTEAFREVVEPNAPAMGLSRTTDAGSHWQQVYGGPRPRRQGQPLHGPFDMPMVFATSSLGFAADGIPPIVPFRRWPGYLWLTRDGGHHWQRQRPPPASFRRACGDAAPRKARYCLFDLPTVRSADRAVVTYLRRRRSGALIAFDTTADGGASWRTAAVRHVVVASTTRRGDSIALLSTPTLTSWWLAAPTSDGLTVQRTTNGGTSWHRCAAALPGRATALAALDGRRALLTVMVRHRGDTSRRLLVTTDAGAHWTPADLDRRSG